MLYCKLTDTVMMTPAGSKMTTPADAETDYTSHEHLQPDNIGINLPCSRASDY